MKTITLSSITAGLLLCLTSAFGIPGIPEPGVVMYGRVLDIDTGDPVAIRSLSWTISQTGQGAKTFTYTLADDALSVATIDGEPHYVLQIPFESWVDLNGDGNVTAADVDASPRRFRLTAGSPFTRSAQANGAAATITGGAGGGFIFPTQSVPLQRGTVVRVDLRGQASTGGDPNFGDTVVDLALGSISEGGQLVDSTLNWEGESGEDYSVEYSDSLTPGSWFALGNTTADGGGNASFSVPENLPPPAAGKRFFRVRLTNN
jgi:hypothetical protein